MICLRLVRGIGLLFCALLGLLIATYALPASAQIPLFNGAEGYGGTFTGSAPVGGWFSNAEVYHVTTTADPVDGSGSPVITKGTLRGAFYTFPASGSPKQNAANRIIVFDVGGTFDISADGLDMKTISNIYVAGQTAPSPVVVYGNTSQITHSNNTLNSNVILRYMTFRKGTGNGADAITFAGGANDGTGSVATNMIIDHVSASWSEDEVLSVANSNTNITVQYTMMTDSLTSGHQYGSLLRPRIDSQVTFHHNLYGNDESRNPRFGSYNNKTLTADFVDNVIYNWSLRAGYAGGGSDGGITEKANVNWVGNYAIAGPATPAGFPSTTAVTKDIGGSNALEFKVYQALNLIDSNHNAVRDGVDTGWDMFRVSTPVGTPLPEADKAATPFATPAVTTTGAADAYTQVLNYVGNYWWSRDAIDQRIISNVQNNTQPAGGIPATAPVPAELAGVLSNPTTTRPVGYDSDGDGMPDLWEAQYGLNPNSAADGKLDFDSDGYVNVQEYLDEVGAFPSPAPIVFNGTTNTRYAQITNWKTNDGGNTAGSNWQPTRFDEARINSGTVVVDAAGQHAGTLKLATGAGNDATLNITGGWLDVATQVTIGADPAATAALNLSGGVLSAPTLNKGAGGSFNFTGGILHADTVNFSLVNNGGIISPGHSIGQTHVVGDLTLNTGSLAIELTSTSSSDTLLVDGMAALGGALNVSLLGSFTPANGNMWQIITAGGISGMFNSVTAGYSVHQQGNNLFLLFGTAPTLAGDYNSDGHVDAADYTVWRDKLGSNTALPNETASPGVVDQDDYDAWKANFGASGSGSSTSGAVPEPTSSLLLILAVLGLAPARRRGR